MNQTTSVKVVPLFSGSSGNATYIRFGDRELLVDAGRFLARLCKRPWKRLTLDFRTFRAFS